MCKVKHWLENFQRWPLEQNDTRQTDTVPLHCGLPLEEAASVRAPQQLQHVSKRHSIISRITQSELTNLNNLGYLQS